MDREQGIPDDARDWHPADESSEVVNAPVSPNEQQPIAVPDTQSPAEPGVVANRPTADNPIQEIRIGLWQTLGQIDRPTRVVMILKDGSTADLPWEEAEAILPPEYRMARELGEAARSLERQVHMFDTALRSETDVMQRSGHIKDALLRPLGKTRKPVEHLNQVVALAQEIGDIAQHSFLELRRMTNAHESRSQEIQVLGQKLNECRQRFESIRADTGGNYPAVQTMYERFSRSAAKELPNLDTKNRPSATGLEEGES